MNITRPTLLLDAQKCKTNIRKMATKAAGLGLTFRPHFKTHQSLVIGEWFREVGVTAITVSSVVMAEYFANTWDDITIAFPINAREHESINKLASRVTLNLCVVNAAALDFLATKLKHPLGIFIEVDTGYHRTGIDPTNKKLIDTILNFIEQDANLMFKGFLCHAGNSYKARSRPEIEAVHNSSQKLIANVSAHYRNRYPNHTVSVGDTPSCSVVENFGDVDEIRPGNFVFYDLTQCAIGSCNEDAIAVAMACPIVAIYPDRHEVVVHGGAVHFSKDFLQEKYGLIHYGKVVLLSQSGWATPSTTMYIKSLSQEHGIICASEHNFKKLSVGDVLGVLPVHSCLTADAMKKYSLLNGEEISMMV